MNNVSSFESIIMFLLSRPIMELKQFAKAARIGVNNKSKYVDLHKRPLIGGGASSKVVKAFLDQTSAVDPKTPKCISKILVCVLDKHTFDATEQLSKRIADTFKEKQQRFVYTDRHENVYDIYYLVMYLLSKKPEELTNLLKTFK
jgi:hypothetical protein